MLKKHTAQEGAETCNTTCCGKKVISCLGTVLAMVFAFVALVFASKAYKIGQANYDLEILKAGGQANFEKMNNLYASPDFVKYMTDQTDGSVQSFNDMILGSAADTDAPSDAPAAEGTAKEITTDQVSSVLSDSYFYGDENAPIVIIEYSDFMCSYCQRHYNDQTIEKVVEANPNVALVFKNFPLSFHETADLGSRGAYCAGKLGGKEAYYKYLPEAFAAGSFTEDSVIAIGTKIGLKEADMKKCYNDPATATAVTAETTEGQTMFGVTGTPGNIVLNRETGKFIEISGAYPQSSFEDAVAQLSN